MQDYFENEIKRTEQELVDLKTAQQKFAGVVPILSKSINVSIPLKLNSSKTAATGTQLYRITTAQDSILVATLAKYYDNVYVEMQVPQATRQMTARLGKISNNVYILDVGAFGTAGANSDVTTLINGGSVTLTNTLTVQSTNDFTLEAI